MSVICNTVPCIGTSWINNFATVHKADMVLILNFDDMPNFGIISEIVAHKISTFTEIFFLQKIEIKTFKNAATYKININLEIIRNCQIKLNE